MKTSTSAVNGNSELPEISALKREEDVLRAAVGALRTYLPATWGFETRIPGSISRVDAELSIRAPDGREITALVEVKQLINTREVPVILDRLRKAADSTTDSEMPLVIVTRYLAPTTRERIVELGAGYIDVTGNLYLATENPSLLLRDKGADRDPWRGPGRPRGTLKGPPAARIARALIDFSPPYSIPDLATRANTSTGAAYRVVEFLEEQGLVERTGRGPITSVKWRAVLERWSRDYEFAESNTVATYLEPRGLSKFKDCLRNQSRIEYVITGSMATEAAASYAPTRLAMLYVKDIDAAATDLGLRTTTTGANVVLATSDYDVVFARAREVDGLQCAALSQVAVDLLSGPGRNPSEALALIEWMEKNESVWRR